MKPARPNLTAPLMPAVHGDRMQPCGEAVRDATDRFRAAHDRLDTVIAAAVARRRGHLENGTAPDDADLVDQPRTLICARHDTTATSLVWILLRRIRIGGAPNAHRRRHEPKTLHSSAIRALT